MFLILVFPISRILILVIIKKGEGAQIATVISKMDNFGTRNFDGAKPFIINQNGTNLALSNRGVKFDR